MSNKPVIHVLGGIHGTRDAVGALPWTIELRLRGSRRFLYAVPAPDFESAVESIAPFELHIGRDFLVAIRALVFELTGFPVDETDLPLWIDRLSAADPAYSKNARAALASQAAYSIKEPPGTLPILYRNRRLLIVDARAALDFSYGRQVVLIDHVLDIEAGTADWHRTGEYKGFVIYGPHELSVSGATLADLAANCLDTYLWTFDH